MIGFKSATTSLLLPLAICAQIFENDINPLNNVFESNDWIEDGYYPSFSNGFIAGDAGCSNVSNPPTTGGSCGRVYMGGVFNNETYYDDEASTFPRRAAIHNPFSLYVVESEAYKLDFIGASLDISNGTIRNKTHLITNDGDEWEVEVGIWAHRRLRNVLVFDLQAQPISSGRDIADSVEIQLSSCGIGLSGTANDFDVTVLENSTDLSLWEMEVRLMESPPMGSTFSQPAQTRVGLAFENVGSTVQLSSTPLRFYAVYVSSVETGVLSMNVSDVAMDRLKAIKAMPTDSLEDLHNQAWQEVWQGGVEITGNDTIAKKVNASIYAIVSSLREDFPLGASPCGLARNGYEGHSFWDAETWMLPGLVALYPTLAENLLTYRLQRLAAAREAARLAGLTCASEGCARWPWESALLGFGVSPWLLGDEYEVHITGDIALAFQLMYRAQGNDKSFLTKEAPCMLCPTDERSTVVDVIMASASYFHETAKVDPVSGNYTFYDVIGPDENAGVVNSSAYTNAVAQRTLEWALEVCGVMDLDCSSEWQTIASRIYLPIEALPDSSWPGHPEYTGYAGQDINQADVALLQYPLYYDMDQQVAENDLLYYESRSSTANTRGFYTGDSAYSIAWLSLGNQSRASLQFEQAFNHIDSHFGVWMETVDGGNLNFLTGAGGFLQNIVNGYAGVRYTSNGELEVSRPVLPGYNISHMELRGLALGSCRVNLAFSDAHVKFSQASEEANSCAGVRNSSTGVATPLPASFKLEPFHGPRESGQSFFLTLDI